mgnify:CR=1 FL=1
MLNFVEFGLRRSYPHLLPVDVGLWEKFIHQYPGYFSQVAYDVHVGEGIIIPDGYDESLRGMAKTLTQKRIDVVGMAGGIAWIVEVKSYAGVTAVGQVMTYRQLLSQDHPNLTNIGMMILTDVFQPDMVGIMSELNISFVAVGQ